MVLVIRLVSFLQPIRNGHILRKIQSSKIEPGRNRNYEQPITSNVIEAVLKNLKKQKQKTLKSLGPDGFIGASCKHLEKS